MNQDDAPGSVEIVGWAAPQETSEIIAPRGPIYDPAVLARGSPQTAKMSASAAPTR